MDVCLLWVLCVVRQRSLRRADHSSRGVLPTVVCRVWSRKNLMNEKAIARDWAASAIGKIPLWYSWQLESRMWVIYSLSSIRSDECPSCVRAFQETNELVPWTRRDSLILSCYLLTTLKLFSISLTDAYSLQFMQHCLITQDSKQVHCDSIFYPYVLT